MRREVVDRRREVQLAQEPGFDGVLIGGAHVEQMRAHQRPHVTGDDILRHRLGGGGRLPRPDHADPAPLPSDTASVTIAAQARIRGETRAGRRVVATATRRRSGAV